jgi:hypothetical protein
VASWVESDEKRQIAAIVADVDMWLSRCRDAIAAPNADPSMPLKDMLSRVRAPAANGLCYTSRFSTGRVLWSCVERVDGRELTTGVG